MCIRVRGGELFDYLASRDVVEKEEAIPMQLLQRLKCVHDELTHERLRNDLSAKVVSQFSFSFLESVTQCVCTKFDYKFLYSQATSIM